MSLTSVTGSRARLRASTYHEECPLALPAAIGAESFRVDTDMTDMTPDEYRRAMR